MAAAGLRVVSKRRNKAIAPYSPVATWWSGSNQGPICRVSTWSAWHCLTLNGPREPDQARIG